MKIFYENLYRERDTDDFNDNNHAHVINNLTKLDNTDKLQLEREISIADLEYIVHKSKNNKSPGPDGFSNEFFKIFWNQIKFLLLKLIQYFREKGELQEFFLNGGHYVYPQRGENTQ